MSKHETLRVELAGRSYDILIGQDLLATADAYVVPLLRLPRCFIITDETVADLHLATLERALARSGVDFEALVLPAGEATKSFTHLASLCERLLATGIERSSTVIALGGGVIGDIAGFAAAILLRGIDYIQVPTTLLAQVDSSVGGKTGINTAQGKNLVGAFHQPRLVLADSGVLDTLGKRELLAGYAEIVKYALIDNPDFFDWLEGHGHLVVERDPAALGRAVRTSCSAKAQIVRLDEREQGQRALLNLGHTFAHALEAECGYGEELLHGEAVAIGMVMAFELSVQLGLCPPEDADRVRRHLASVDLPTGFERLGGRAWSPRLLLEHMQRDKKVQDGQLTFVLTRGIGKAEILRAVPTDEVEHLLAESIAQTLPLAGHIVP